MYREREEAMAALFDRLDHDNDGKIGPTEFRSFVDEFREQSVPTDRVDDMFERIDVDEDGLIEFEELVCWWEDQ